MQNGKDNNNDTNIAWQYYELGKQYNNSLVPNQYRLVNSNIAFLAGNQWIHLKETPASAKLPKPTFNILKRVEQLFLASLTSSAVTIKFDPLAYYDGNNISDPDADAATYATAEVRNLFEKFKMDYRIRDALHDGAQTGDYCAHFYFDPDALPYGGAFGPYRGEIQMELVDGINVMFGNPNTTDVESQPYILVVGRDTVENLSFEAKRAKKNRTRLGKGGEYSGDGALVQADSEWQEQAGIGGKTELAYNDDRTGKALYVYMYTKVSKEKPVIDEATGLPLREKVLNADGEPVMDTDKDGKPVLDAEGNPIFKTREMKQLVTTVHVTKATKSGPIFEDVDTGLTRYPIAWGNWEKQKNQYHGRALITGLIPNQIFINTMFATVMRHLQLQAFPKTLYNADLISQWNNEVGVAIGVKNMMPGQSLEQVAKNLQPADMSNQIVSVIDKAMAYTKECLGATDAQMGNVKPDNTSALMVLQSSAEVPLENIRAGLYEWVEDIGAILLDMMGTYYGERPIVRERDFEEPVADAAGNPMIDPMTGLMMTTHVTRRVIETYDFSQFKHLWLNVGVDAGATTRYSEIAMVQTMDNLRRDGTMDVIDYLERIPDTLIPRKSELIETIKKRTMQAQTQPVSAVTQDGQATAPGLTAAGPGSGSKVGAMGGGGPTMGGPLEAGKALSKMPESIQNKYTQLPKEAQRALIAKASL